MLSTILAVSGIDEIPQFKKMFSELQPHTQNTHVMKAASEAIAAILDVIAPGHAGALREAKKRSKIVDKVLEIDELDDTEKIYLQALAETYEHTTGWDTRQQILSIMADLVPFFTLQKFSPGITKYQVKTVCRHKELYGRGAPILETRSSRMRVSLVQPDHCLPFITPAHMSYRIFHLVSAISNCQTVKSSNVILTMIKQRTITQYVQY